MSSGLVDTVKKIKSRLMKLMNKAIDTLYEKVFTPLLNIPVSYTHLTLPTSDLV